MKNQSNPWKKLIGIHFQNGDSVSVIICRWLLAEKERKK